MPEADDRMEWVLLANFNAMAFDFVTRQKIQGQTLNKFIVEQLPVISPARYELTFGSKTALEIVRDHVLRLTYTAYDMRPFARDLGYDGEPFIWNDEDRRHLRARLDALYFHLYGLSREDAGYVMETFPDSEAPRRVGVRELSDSVHGAGVYERAAGGGCGG